MVPPEPIGARGEVAGAPNGADGGWRLPTHSPPSTADLTDSSECLIRVDRLRHDHLLSRAEVAHKR